MSAMTLSTIPENLVYGLIPLVIAAVLTVALLGWVAFHGGRQ